MRQARRMAVRLTLCAFALLLLPASASAKFLIGLSGPEYVSGDAAERTHWNDAAVDAAADIIRINVTWRSMVTGTPADPSNPLDPAYDFSALDAAVQSTTAAGMEVMLTTTLAPDYAEGAGRPANVRPGTWKVDPDKYAQFGRALASRYSGDFLGLPRVRYFQAWNEPNLSTYLTPQYENGQRFSPGQFRLLLNAFGDAVHAVRGDNVVITGGTAPFGDEPGGARMRPLAFWRDVLCLKRKGRKLRGTNCPVKARFDILAHHPINTAGAPTHQAVNRDDATTADFHKIRTVVRTAEAKHRVDGGRHPLWATEVWLESNPPDTNRGRPLKQHAEWNEQSLFLLWRQGASAVFNLQVRDPVYDPQRPEDTIESGLYFHDGGKKPAFEAWRFPFVVHRKGTAWGRAPVAGKVKIQRRRGGGWQTVASERAKAHGIFTHKVDVDRGARFRAVLNGEKSLTWRVSR